MANSNKEHPKEGNNSPSKECIPNKELALECMPPHYRESTANKSSPNREHTQVAKSKSNTASARMRNTEIPTLAQDQGCGWGMVLPMPMPMHNLGNWGNL